MLDRKTSHKYVEMKQHCPEQPMSQKIKWNIKKYLDINENGNTTYQNLMGYSKSSSKREV